MANKNPPTRKPNRYHQTDKVILRSSGVIDGKRRLYFESKQDNEMIETHEIHQDKIIFWISKELGDLKSISYFGKFDPQKIKTINDVQNATSKLFDQYGGGFKNKSLRYFIKNHMGSMTDINISDDPTKLLGGKKISINRDDLRQLTKDLNIQMKANNSELNAILSNFWSSKASELQFKINIHNSNKSLILRNLNEKLSKQLTADEIDNVGEFYFKALEKFKSPQIKKRQAEIVSEKAKILSLDGLISKYEKLLKKDPLESEWQKFFNDFITLFDSRYQNIIDSKNISVASTKYPDLILLDVYGFIDLYELKRAGATLLREDRSHNNFYWSDEMAKTVAQASLYLQTIKDNASMFSRTIEEEANIKVKVINPKAFIVAGTSSQLDSEKKQNQFKVLRESLKDVNFILYDELLVHLKNLVTKLKDSK